LLAALRQLAGALVLPAAQLRAELMALVALGFELELAPENFSEVARFSAGLGEAAPECLHRHPLHPHPASAGLHSALARALPAAAKRDRAQSARLVAQNSNQP
jgi:uncharacterized membrane protein